jgi:phosphoribosylformylglycinamidine cyclo-ligase
MGKMTYKEAGVDTLEGQRAVRLMKDSVKSTFNEQVLTDLGGFGGLFALDLKNMEEPVLVSGTDGVGTKLKIAFLTDRHDTVGIDLVAMCVNDILCQGAKPLFFLDYMATGHLKAEKAASIVSGIAAGCRMSGCALIGGETAEMPGFYGEGEYDLAGFAVGIVDKKRIVDGSRLEDGDVLIGLASSGIHSNGYSLVRKVIFDRCNFDVDDVPEGHEKTIGDLLIEPTRIYVKPVLELMDVCDIKGMVHITGGGFYENIPRIIPEGLGADIETGSWTIPPVFELLKEKGNLDEMEMYKTFNMGIGLMVAVPKAEADKAIEALKALGETAYIVGKITDKHEGVALK